MKHSLLQGYLIPNSSVFLSGVKMKKNLDSSVVSIFHYPNAEVTKKVASQSEN